MIVPMKKVSIVVLNKERLASLEMLKKIGVVHLEHIEGSGEKLSAYKEVSNNATNAVSILSEIKLPKKQSKSQKPLSNDEIAKKCTHIIELAERKKKLAEENVNYQAELDRFSLWGDINLQDFAFLRENGVSLKLYEIPEDKYSLIENDENIKAVLVNKTKKTVRFLLVGGDVETRFVTSTSLSAGSAQRADDVSSDTSLGVSSNAQRPVPPEAFCVPFPSHSTSEIRDFVKANENEILNIENELKNEAVFKASIEKFKVALESDILFENIYSGMGKEDSGKDADLAWISGYVPVDCMEVLKKTASEQSWALASSNVADDDENVPTKLKNNKLVSLIYPLTDFLGTVPGYHEYDISGWFLLFFTIFFGMIFGDGGYGLLIVFASIIMMIKSKKGGLAPFMMLLGLATVAWGTVTCTWFGLQPSQLPEWLVQLSIPQISNAYSDIAWIPFWLDDDSKGYLTSANNLQIFCFTLAFLQLSVAHLKGMKRNRKSLKMLGELGSLLQLWGMYYVVLSMVVSSKIFGFGEVIYGVPIGTVSLGLVAFGFALSFIFSNYEGNIGKSILESCKNIISVLLGVVNVFSDIVSYIRLWAVGLAGAAISNTVNEMAGPLLGPALMFIAFMALVLFGHGLNMILNLLSVIVHGVRLNTLEFSSHLGMSWSGFKYNPFAEKDK